MNTDTEKLNIYIAGPMRGLPDLNRAEFHVAAYKLEMDGIYQVHNPAEWDENLGLTAEDLCTKKELLKAMKRDMLAIFDCDCIYMLRGWEQSAGARLEHSLATFMGIIIMYQV
tara:strand:- start:396 stop:734 length:339 start_codon:yes stop_codon:yes gene_type:complete